MTELIAVAPEEAGVRTFFLYMGDLNAARRRMLLQRFATELVDHVASLTRRNRTLRGRQNGCESIHSDFTILRRTALIFHYLGIKRLFDPP